MIPDLFSGAAASAAAYLPVPAETSTPTAPCTGASDVFAALLADTIAPTPAASGVANAPSTSASAPLADFWFNALIGASPITEIQGSESDDAEASTEGVETGTEDIAVAPRETESDDVSALMSEVPMPVQILVPLPPPPAMTASASETSPKAPVSNLAAGLFVAEQSSAQPGQAGTGAAQFVRPAEQGVTQGDSGTQTGTQAGPDGARIGPDAAELPQHLTPPRLSADDPALPARAEPVKAADHIEAKASFDTNPSKKGIDRDVNLGQPTEAPTGATEPIAQEVSQPSRAAVALASAVGSREPLRQQPAQQQQQQPAEVAADVMAAGGGEQLANIAPAQPSATPSKSGEASAKRVESASFDSSIVALAGDTAGVQISNEGGESSQDGTARNPSHGAARELAATLRALEMPAAVGTFPIPAVEQAVRTSVVEAVAPLVPPTPGQEAENVTRMVESMRFQVRQGVQEATVRLKPEHLGEVTISIRVDRGSVSATVHTDTPAVQEWLESQEAKLRSGLAEQGLHLERFVVQRDRQQESRQQRHAPPQRYRQSQNQGQRFEVTV